MSRRQLPRTTAAILDAATFLPGEIAVDTTNDELRYDGDGSTVGGIKVARKDGVGTSVTATGSTTARTLADRFAEVFNIEDYGATAASTNNYAAVNLAIAACNTAGGGTIVIPEGNFDIDLPSATGLTSFGVGTRVKGMGRYESTLTINCTTTAYLNAFGNNGNIIFEDLRIVFNLQDTQTAALIILTSNMEFYRCDIVSNNTVIADDDSNDGIWINVPSSGTFDWLVIEDCTWSGWHYPLLRANASTAVITNTFITNCQAHDNGVCHLEFNTPNGSWSNIYITNLQCGDQSGVGAGLGFGLSFASASNVHINGFTFIGTVDGEAIHVEENCDGFHLNDFYIEVTSDEASEGDGVALLDSAVGTHQTPITMTIASPAVVSATGHGRVAGSAIKFSTTGALPTGVAADTTYYVLSTDLTADTFKFSATSGGAAVNTSGTQSGVHTLHAHAAPTNWSITNGIIKRSSAGGGGSYRGLWLLDATGTTPLTNGFIDNVTVTGFTSDQNVHFQTSMASIRAGQINCADTSDIAAAATVDISKAKRDYVNVTGSGASITALGSAPAGVRRVMRFNGANTLTHHATSLIIEGGANVTTASGDTALAVSLGSGNWLIQNYTRANGQPLVQIPISTGVSGLGSNVAAFLATPSSANLAAAVTDEDGTGLVPLEATGTFNPDLTFATPGDFACTLSTQNGYYTKIGRVVFCQFEVNTSAFTHTTASGLLTLTGLPFTSATGPALSHGVIMWEGISKAGYTNVTLAIAANATTANFIGSGSGVDVSGVTATDVPTGGTPRFRGFFSYIV